MLKITQNTVTEPLLSVYFHPNLKAYKTTQFLPLKNMASPLPIPTTIFLEYTLLSATVETTVATFIAVGSLIIPRNPDANSFKS